MKFPIVLFGLLSAVLTFSANAATFVVNTTDDTSDGACDAAHCSLREAITAANAAPGQDVIEFSGIVSPYATSPVTIALTAVLPTISDTVIGHGDSWAWSWMWWSRGSP